MTKDEKTMLPAMMPVVAIGKGRVTWFPNGVFGEWQDFETFEDCLRAIGDGMYVLCSTFNGKRPV